MMLSSPVLSFRVTRAAPGGRPMRAVSDDVTLPTTVVSSPSESPAMGVIFE